MVELPLYPETIPDVVTALISTDQASSKKTDQMLEKVLADSSNYAKAHSYMTNVVFVVRGKVAEINDLGGRLKARADDVDAINEEAIVVSGTLITALTQSGNIPLMAIYSGFFAALSKIGFKLAKAGYRDWWLKAKLEKGTNEALAEATREATKIFNDAYHENRSTEHVIKTLQVKAKSVANTFL